jgi:hypothetical protein
VRHGKKEADELMRGDWSSHSRLAGFCRYAVLEVFTSSPSRGYSRFHPSSPSYRHYWGRRLVVMLHPQRTAHAARRLAAGMATAVERIGDTKVPMSLLEKGAYINYQRIEDNLQVVRSR